MKKILLLRIILFIVFVATSLVGIIIYLNNIS
jgi:hypothetical protein